MAGRNVQIRWGFQPFRVELASSAEAPRALPATGIVGDFGGTGDAADTRGDQGKATGGGEPPQPPPVRLGPDGRRSEAHR
ncbi:hypothetical protein GCM10023205_80550 [Yinghuangia aomiensis]|uniref:Uncharacterized protein n=1 Tax=Yinghuangia aomiensis TaxID=676205 RepID=A0ABP9IDN4_9ACTN